MNKRNVTSHYLLVLILIMSVITSCTIAPEPIQYNYDECAYCKMKISDIRFGAELVTSKGKIYKYDSAECLFHTFVEQKETDYAFKIVTDFGRPHHLVDAESATYLISENQPSPMGGNISAYEMKEHAEITQKEKGGILLSFQQVVEKYKKGN